MQIITHINRIEIFWKVEEDIKANFDERNYILGVNGVDTSGKTEFSYLLKK